MTRPTARPSTGPAARADRDRSKLEDALARLERCALVPPPQRERIREARHRLADLAVVAAVVGDFKRGKSSIMNALLGEAVLPTGAVPVTGVPTLVRWAERPSLVVATQDDREGAPWPLERLRAAVTEQDNLGNGAGIVEARLGWPAYVSRIDAALMVLSADAPLSAAEVVQMRLVSDADARLGVCLNKVDRLSPPDVRETIAFVRRQLDDVVGGAVPLFAVSARRALEPGGDDGIAAMRRWLVDEVAAARNEILDTRAVTAGRAERAAAVSVLRLEQASLSLPDARIESNRQQLGLAVAVLRTSSDEAKAVFRQACRAAGTTIVEPAADRLRSTLAIRLSETRDRSRWPALQTESADAWCEQVRGEVERNLAPRAARFAEQVRSARDRFLSDASELLAVELAWPPAPPAVLTVTRASIDRTDVAGALAVGMRGMRARAPGAIGRRWRDRAQHAEAAESADQLAGRLRHAAQGALDEAATTWCRQADDVTAGIVPALTEAVERARASALAGSPARSARRDRLAEAEAELDAVSLQLGAG